MLLKPGGSELSGEPIERSPILRNFCSDESREISPRDAVFVLDCFLVCGVAFVCGGNGESVNMRYFLKEEWGRIVFV